MTNEHTRGFGAVLILLIAALLLGGGAYLYKQARVSTSTPAAVTKTPAEEALHIVGANIYGMPVMLRLIGRGFTSASRVHAIGNGFDGFLETKPPHFNDAGLPAPTDEFGNTLLYLDASLPSTYKPGYEYTVYVSNGDGSTSNVVLTPFPTRGQ